MTYTGDNDVTLSRSRVEQLWLKIQQSQEITRNGAQTLRSGF
ncbi:hypothetical protein [Bartonella bovis]|nr:hypothetical protein [Bartonella bovis]